jgi:hypothetical protein
MSSTATADQSETLHEQLEIWEEFKTETRPLIGAFGLLKEYYDALREHGQLIGRPMVKELLEVSHQTIEYYLKRGRLTDVSIGPMKLIPVSEVLSIWKERHEAGKLDYKPEGHLGGKEGPLSNKQAFEMITSLCLDDGLVAALSPKAK